ncbi:MAG: molybdopterin molybdotransferase MoeA [Chloroflexi bacterium]|nr:molybdopterin molybdotransferase MoeA [Chloroflexota bacterium]
MSSTPEFFNVQTVQVALALLAGHAVLQPRAVACRVYDALGRVLVTPPVSPTDLPTFVRSTVDGYAVRAEDTFGASQSLPAYLTCVGRVAMGAAAAVAVRPGQTVEIYTGAMLPAGANAVVMVERTQAVTDTEIEVLAPVAPGENLVQIGEDVRQGDAILPAGHRIRPQDIGGLLSVGILEVEVAAAPRVAIVGSGDELVLPEQNPAPGQIRDINSYTLAALLAQAGAEPVIMGIAADTPEALYQLASAGL